MLGWIGCCCKSSGCPSLPATLTMTDAVGTRDIEKVPSVLPPSYLWRRCFNFTRGNTDVHIGGNAQCQGASGSIAVQYGMACRATAPPEEAVYFELELSYYTTACFEMYDRGPVCTTSGTSPGDPLRLGGSPSGRPLRSLVVTSTSHTFDPFSATFSIPATSGLLTLPISGTVVVSEAPP